MQVQEVVIRCPEKKRDDTSIKESKVLKEPTKKKKVEPVEVEDKKEKESLEDEIIAQIVPDPDRKRKYDYTPKMEMPFLLKLFGIVAPVFFTRVTIWSDGAKRKRKKSVVPVSICPELVFYTVNFLHAPIVGYMVFVGWYCMAYRETILGFFAEEIFEPRTYWCDPMLATPSIFLGINIDAIRYILVALLILGLCIIGVLGMYLQSKLLLIVWCLMFGVLWLEWFLAYVTEHSLWLNRCYKFATQLRYCFLRAIDNYWSSFHTYYAVGPARGIDRIQETMQCCGARGPNDYLNRNVSVPSSCCNIFTNRNLYCAANPDQHLVNVYQEGCLTKITDRCYTIRSLLHFGLRPFMNYHILLFIVGFIAILSYLAILRTMVIYAYAYSENVRRYTFPKRAAKVPTLKDLPAGTLLRLHKPHEYIKPKPKEEEWFQEHFSPKVEEYIENLRTKHGIGDEMLGYGHKYGPRPKQSHETKLGSEDELPLWDTTCDVESYKKYVTGRAKIKESAMKIVSQSWAKYHSDPQNIKFSHRKIPSKDPDFDLTPQALGEPLKDGDKFPKKMKRVWKWKVKNRLSVRTFLDEL